MTDPNLTLTRNEDLRQHLTAARILAEGLPDCIERDMLLIGIRYTEDMLAMGITHENFQEDAK